MLAKRPDSPVLLLSDKGVVAAGIADRVREICRAAASSYNEFLEVPAEPREDEVTAVVASMADMDVDVIVAVITPYFIGCTQEGLFAHYSRVADILEKPVFLYDIPARTQNHIEPETASRLAEHPNIHGIKDSGGGQESLDAYLTIANNREDFDVFSGPDSLIYYALSKGARGCISGLGNIGKSLSLKACALGMDVIASELSPDRNFAATNQIRLVSLDELLAEADYVSLHVFGGKDNVHLIGTRELSLMKKSAYIMNFARGEILDLDALATALELNQLLGAAIDAYVVEPPDRNHLIFSLPNVIFTPHSGADTIESVERMGLMNVADIDFVLAGEKSPRVLNPEIYGQDRCG